jgi:hypothetical protein
MGGGGGGGETGQGQRDLYKCKRQRTEEKTSSLKNWGFLFLQVQKIKSDTQGILSIWEKGR